jgi:four helix bundle protein
MYSKEEKVAFIEKMKARTKKFAIDIIHFCDKLPKTQACRTISFQLIKSATSVGANYRAACRGRSKAEFHAKISIVVEEADESEYWLEIIEGTNISCDSNELKRLLKEIDEIIRVVATARKNNSKKNE